MKMTMMMSGFVGLIAMIAIVSGGILKYESEAEDIFRYLLGGDKVANYGKFKFVDCGDKSKELFHLSKLVVKPDPLRFPGILTVGFSALLKETLTSPLEAQVEISKKEGGGYIPLPCIGQIGSCHYNDICQLFSGQCPRPFSDAGIPCSCPFSKGSFNLDPTDFQISATLLPSGDYMAQGNVTYKNVQVACYQIYVSFA